MSYESVGEIVRGQGGRAFNPRRRSYRMRPGMGLEIGSQSAWSNPSRMWSFYLLPGTIGLLGLWVVATIFGAKGA